MTYEEFVKREFEENNWIPAAESFKEIAGKNVLIFTHAFQTPRAMPMVVYNGRDDSLRDIDQSEFSFAVMEKYCENLKEVFISRLEEQVIIYIAVNCVRI